ncbi:bifunctional hydroxymethylpyrimidine kinase/phosphomethylpyrimidine kinase [Arthrobacter antibioticus]|uniref:bifunctional hydroxymethylpyrimidine kinase/phosphomethylpyrimidine kinase n=1 Tax=Arthrobacter sp. H35-MC1 TaxID=3046203 RepID=UPI0024B951B3|nr:bifunctional hydroxymethylpyrimidine kinase/phosphomethylpyrimidine kinase [Arthrobacter sp. H35-MC1]MDJ0315998.1 bifunctional hydroxymethylpyrimidine kinase/phosphomethylpyrimidine kinase [Arthrobacter sp. H35-MC1]
MSTYATVSSTSETGQRTTVPAAVKHPRILSIAGSDSSGGAGIQADIKSISAHGGYAMTAITALTAQNTRGVQDIHTPPATFLTAQLDAVASDVTIDAVKIGMLGTEEVINAVREWLARTRPAVVVLDPVMVATSGDMLVAPAAREALLELIKSSHLVTPNLPELGVLLDQPEAASWQAAVQQGKELAATHEVLVLVKGGHLAGELCPDALVHPDGVVNEFIGARIDTVNTHGTGCSLSAAVATLQAQTGDWIASVQQAKEWLGRALETSEVLEVGSGAGPVNHLHALWENAAPGVGQFSAALWAHIEPQRQAIFALEFIKELAAGTLQRNHFAYYLVQDALYLSAYSRVLARASSLAPTEMEQKFWAEGAQNCLEVELQLHRNWLNGQPANPQQGPVTKHYVDHLQGVGFSGSYAEVVAAVLPCYWLYAEVGRVLHADYLSFSGEHPYGTWLATYADDDFAQAAATAVSIMDTAARRGSALERERMRAAFAHSVQYEVDFFAAPHQHVPSEI